MTFKNCISYTADLKLKVMNITEETCNAIAGHVLNTNKSTVHLSKKNID